MDSKFQAVIELGHAIGMLIIGALIFWGMYYSFQASHTSQLIGYVNKVPYEITKNDDGDWFLKIGGQEVATLDETNDAPPQYVFKVKTSTGNGPTPGVRIEIGATGSGGLLLCPDCVQRYIALPMFWSRES